MQPVPIDSPTAVSVIITAYNYGHFLADAIESALAQTHSQVEVVVIDDGSTDNTPEVVSKYLGRIKYVRQQNAGLPRARNAGLAHASHPWVVFLDADDILCPWMIETALAVQQTTEPRAAVVQGGWIPFDPSSPEPPRPNQSECQARPVGVSSLVLRNSLAPTALASRQVLLGLGGFDPGAGGADDRDMWIRVATKHPVVVVNALFYRYRLHSESMSHKPEKHSKDTEYVLAKARSNPDIRIPSRVWRESEAIRLHQAAINYSMAGNIRKAVWLCLRSLAACPALSRSSPTQPPLLWRARFLVSKIMSGVLRRA